MEYRWFQLRVFLVAFITVKESSLPFYSLIVKEKTDEFMPFSMSSPRQLCSICQILHPFDLDDLKQNNQTNWSNSKRWTSWSYSEFICNDSKCFLTYKFINLHLTSLIKSLTILMMVQQNRNAIVSTDFVSL